MSSNKTTGNDGWTTVVRPQKKTSVAKPIQQQASQPSHREAPVSNGDQQWDTTTIHRPETKKALLRKGQFTAVPRAGSGSNRQGTASNVRKIEKQVDEEGDYTITKVSTTLASAVTKARLARTDKDGNSMTQEQLAILCNLRVTDVKNIENHTAPYNGAQIQKIARALGVTLKR